MGETALREVVCSPKVVSEGITPRVDAYLGTLPQGIDSYPECTFSADALWVANQSLREFQTQHLPHHHGRLQPGQSRLDSRRSRSLVQSRRT